MRAKQTILQRRLWELLINLCLLFIVFASFGKEQAYFANTSASTILPCQLPILFDHYELLLVISWVLVVMWAAAKSLNDVTSTEPHLVLLSVALDHIVPVILFGTTTILFFTFFPTQYCVRLSAVLDSKPNYITYLLKGFANITSHLFVDAATIGVVAVSLFTLFTSNTIEKLFNRSWEVAFVVFDIAVFYASTTHGFPELSIFWITLLVVLRNLYSIFG